MRSLHEQVAAIQLKDVGERVSASTIETPSSNRLLRSRGLSFRSTDGTVFELGSSKRAATSRTGNPGGFVDVPVHSLPEKMTESGTTVDCVSTNKTYSLVCCTSRPNNRRSRVLLSPDDQSWIHMFRPR